jgi:large subunit ribosomal protein L4
MIVVDAITTSEFKTKTMVAMLNAIGAGKKNLVVLEAPDAMVVKSLANIAGVKVVYANTLNAYDILNCNSIVFAKNAVAKIEEVYA